MSEYKVTVAVPSLNQGRFLNAALTSIFEQEIPAEVFVLDAGSTDETLDVLEHWKPKLAGLRSHRDDGQAAAINEGIAKGTAPYVCWLNSDDYFVAGGLKRLMNELETHAGASMVYGRCWNFIEAKGYSRPVWVEPFSVARLAQRCIISQPGTLMRRDVWEGVGGVNPRLHMAMDYDLWWRILKSFGPPAFVDDFVAVNREHDATKTKTLRRRHYREAIAVVREHYGRVPLKWWIAQPYSVWYKSLFG